MAEHSLEAHSSSGRRFCPRQRPSTPTNVVVDRISISDRIKPVIDTLEAGARLGSFSTTSRHDCPRLSFRHNVVVSLLAILELRAQGHSRGCKIWPLAPS